MIDGLPSPADKFSQADLRYCGQRIRVESAIKRADLEEQISLAKALKEQSLKIVRRGRMLHELAELIARQVAICE
jgi:hypothetical protein